MSTMLTITMNNGRQAETQELPVPVLPSSVEAMRGMLPNLDEIAELVRDKPDVAAQMVADYTAGRMDAVMAAAKDLAGGTAERSTNDNQTGAGAVVVLIIIVIILILLFPKPVKAPTRD